MEYFITSLLPLINQNQEAMTEQVVEAEQAEDELNQSFQSFEQEAGDDEEPTETIKVEIVEPLGKAQDDSSFTIKHFPDEQKNQDELKNKDEVISRSKIVRGMLGYTIATKMNDQITNTSPDSDFLD